MATVRRIKMGEGGGKRRQSVRHVPHASETSRLVGLYCCSCLYTGHVATVGELVDSKLEIIIIIIIIINTFQGRNNITCSTNCKYRTAATLYTLEMWFVSGV
jgi:transposase